ncbi:related to PAN2-component of Pab1p-stimulated poly(A) ribonuclease [Rhynchosporium agropyri]|uniref:PAN2-PAN3 deadenylation complex catalytic subunit PAN2 n=1 Tax=Rhynchosporium agropyri TaxID=914238 RepID=A0A1E1KHJ2_9HELO|nr:related to PAN2-component of Pab1p-stimulated poly(A) ribonuclease [Rhynchosporium agropyri]
MQVGRLLLPPPGPNVLPTPVSTFAFDNSQELLWCGNQFGRVSSFYGNELQRYTSFKCGDGPVYQLLFHEKGVIALGAKSVHMAMRRGPPIWHITHNEMKDLRCMSYTNKGTGEILVAGLQDQMFVIDVEKGVITKQAPTSNHYTMMRRSRYICAATQKGSINIIDPADFRVVKIWNAHSSLIHDMDAQNDFIVSCGCQIRQGQPYILDVMVNVFDLKNMVASSPVPFPAGAAYLRMHPRMSTTLIVISQHGQMHIVDLMNPNSSNIKQVSTMAYISMIEIAPSGEAFVLADAECNIHLWGSPSRMRFGDVSHPVEFTDPEETHIEVDWNPNTPLSSIGMPYYREQLLSSWPSHLIFETGAPPPKIDPQFLATLKSADWGTFGRNRSTSKRYQVENTRTSERTPASLQAPKFLSEKAREASHDGTDERRLSNAHDVGVGDDTSLKVDVPVWYENVEIKYSKFGVDDFDFGYYNKTKYSGLEIHIPNSYANPLLQILHFTPLIRNLALQHTATRCVNELCLLCEMGFLFDMLERAEGSICQATNFLKTFSYQPQAGPLGLLEEDALGSSLTTMLQGLNRFLLDRLTQDWKSILPQNTVFDQILATSATTGIRCMACRSEHTRPGTTFVNELLYPLPKIPVRNTRAHKPSFSQVLKSSVERETTSRGWCSRCQRYQSLATKKTVHGVPAVLMLNAAVNSAEAKQFWAIPGWLPEEIGIIIDQGQFFCYQGDDLKLHIQRGMHNITVYSLVGVAAEIMSGVNQKAHLVSLVNVAHSLPTRPEENRWHLFNDFLVRPIKAAEALTFNTTWKLPSVITYQMKAYNNKIDDGWKQTLDTKVLYMDTNANPVKTYQPLAFPQEAPVEGTIIALDTEFVSVRRPEIEVNAKGDRTTVRPIVYALARVSVVRCSGEDEGLPFIDDYIHIRDTVVDYLTEYSGIRAGDLDTGVSKHNLVALKVVYKKLWILLNLGCRFLGHGLKQDFRVLNVHIPKSKVIDTIDLFYSAANLRRLSLSFLASYLLKEEIQLDTHDSIEDARTALKLYKKFLEFQDAGILELMIQDIYQNGRSMGFKAPAARKDGHLIERTMTPDLPVEGSGSGAHHAVNAVVGGGSGPTTPVRKPVGLAPGTGSTTFSSGWTPGKGGSGLSGSPLR